MKSTDCESITIYKFAVDVILIVNTYQCSPRVRKSFRAPNISLREPKCKNRNPYRALVWKCEGRSPFEISVLMLEENVNPFNPELNPICYLLALLAHHFLHVSRIRVKSLTIRLLMSYIYGAPILDVSQQVSGLRPLTC